MRWSLICLVIVALSAAVWQESRNLERARAGQAKTALTASRPGNSSAFRKTWGNPASLPDHFARHGRDFGAKDADDYARLAWEFLQQAKAKGYPAKVDAEGVVRIYGPRSGAFAAYNRDGTTKTFFKPGRANYFDRQPGQRVDLRSWR